MTRADHDQTGVLRLGAELSEARIAAVAIHGRHQDASFMAEQIVRLNCEDVYFVVPEAAGRAWYPGRFMEPEEVNQPHLDQARERLWAYIETLNAAGFSSDRIALLGFSQGACLVADLLARHPARYAAAICWTGGLIGPPGAIWPSNGRLDRTPVLMSGRELDEWVPAARVRETAGYFRALGGSVVEAIETGTDHGVSDEEIKIARTMLL